MPRERFSIRKIHHLIRYFVLAAILVFAAYVKEWNDGVVFFFIGPPVYLAYGLKSLIYQYLRMLPSSPNIDHFAFVLPVTLFYYGIIGFQVKLLLNERGLIRLLSIAALMVFIIYIHHWCRQDLMGYLTPNP